MVKFGEDEKGERDSKCLFFQLVLKYSSEESIRLLVDRLEWIIVPVVNVDGYIYSHKEVSHAYCVQMNSG